MNFPYKSIWKPKVPTRVAFVLSTAALGRTLTTTTTLDNFRKMNIVAITGCCMCKRNGYTVDHLLLHCSIARVVDYGFSLFGVQLKAYRFVRLLASLLQSTSEHRNLEEDSSWLNVVNMARKKC